MNKIGFFVALTVGILIISLFPLSKKSLIKTENSTEKLPYSAIINVWQLDMVEAGKGSRKSFLEKVSKTFEKENGVLINVSVESKSSAEEKMANGVYPDVISYSFGLDLPLEKLVALDGKNSLGSFNDKNYALCWGYGGYVIICRKGNDFQGNLYVSQNEFTQPLISYYSSGFRFDNMKICAPVNAYSNFLQDSKGVLIGTQRDLFRLSKREVDVDVKLLSNFSDIVLFVSTIENNNGKSQKAKEFCKYLSSLNQTELDSIGMLSFYDKGKNINLQELKVFENFYPKSCLPIFTKDEDLLSLKTFLADFSKSDKEKLNRIKNVVQ